MEVAEALDNAQDISPALEATEDFLHCLDGIYDRNRCQNHAADRQDVSNSGGGKFGRGTCSVLLHFCARHNGDTVQQNFTIFVFLHFIFC